MVQRSCFGRFVNPIEDENVCHAQTRAGYVVSPGIKRGRTAVAEKDGNRNIDASTQQQQVQTVAKSAQKKKARSAPNGTEAKSAQKRICTPPPSGPRLLYYWRRCRCCGGSLVLPVLYWCCWCGGVGCAGAALVVLLLRGQTFRTMAWGTRTAASCSAASPNRTGPCASSTAWCRPCPSGTCCRQRTPLSRTGRNGCLGHTGPQPRRSGGNDLGAMPTAQPSFAHTVHPPMCRHRPGQGNQWSDGLPRMAII